MRRIRWKLVRCARVLAQVDWWHEGWLFLQMLSFALLVPWLMRLRLPRLHALLLARSPRPLQDLDEVRQTSILHCMEVILALGKPLSSSRCLVRGVTLYYFLPRAGLPVALAFGIRHADDFAGHCWLLIDGQPFAEPIDPTAAYTTTYTMSAL